MFLLRRRRIAHDVGLVVPAIACIATDIAVVCLNPFDLARP